MEDRRKKENLALRNLVDAMKEVIDARDALWALNLFDRLFRPGKSRAIIQKYDQASRKVQESVRALVEATREEEQNAAKSGTARSRPPLVSEKEFEMLLGRRPPFKHLFFSPKSRKKRGC